MGTVAVGTVEAALHVVAVVQDHPQHHLVLQRVLHRRGEVGGVDPGVVVDVGPGLQQGVDHLVVALPEGHLQAADGVLVHHGAGLQQLPRALQVVVGHGEEQGGAPLVVVVTAHPLVQHHVGVVARAEQRLDARGVAPRRRRVEGAHPALLHRLHLGHWDEVLQGTVTQRDVGTAL